jgi:hypothetical protein
MLAVRSPIASLGQCVLGIKRKCIMLIATACDSYRPERHYMRGPGPKCFAKRGVVPLGRYVEARQVRDHWKLTSESISSKHFFPLHRAMGNRAPPPIQSPKIELAQVREER